MVGASWSRFSTPEPQANLLSVEERRAGAANYEELFAEFLSTSSATADVVAPGPVTGTDLIGRQLMIDYLNLSGNGQATPENLKALADQYVDSIPTLHASVTVGYQDLTTTSNTRASIEMYANKVGEIYKRYSKDLGGLSESGGVLSDLTKTEYDYMLKAGTAYENRAIELKNTAVPVALASAHLKLININLSSAAALKAAANTEKDPATGFAGMLAINTNLDEEITALQEIVEIMTRSNY